MTTNANNSIRLLCVDDSPLDCKYLEMMIRVKGLPAQIQSINNPLEALEELEAMRHRSDGWPDVILVDIKMPLMTGFEFVEAYQKRFAADFPHTRIYISSASIQISDREQAEKLPLVQAFLEKPISEEVFRTRFLNLPTASKKAG